MLITNESVENYLETILRLSEKLPVVRSVDIAEELGYKKSSISVAMKNLKNQEYITVSDRGYIELTESGMGIARKIYERHDVISAWLVTLGVDPQVASDDACKLEHVLSDQTFNALKNHINGLR
jgi:DtxR family Mn-dependent transcriptional regulator